ncbi:MAG: sigma-70 family RNA polymerase sigma factor [Armatimonadetes bacterium]|nr:sigma-70 family RNA polymerase sigma factor [Armatimonadota bacterium]
MKNRSAGRESEHKIFVDNVTPHLDLLYRQAVRLCRNEKDAEDLVQETCLRAYRSLATGTVVESFKAWLLTILTHLVINEYRKKERHTVEPTEGEELDRVSWKEASEGLGDPQEEVFRHVLDQEIMEAFQVLPPEYAAAVSLCDLEGFTYEEITKILACPIGTVRSRISRGRRMLYNKLRDYAGARGFAK